MRKFIQQKLKDQKGLTLIELLAVIVIIAIIAAIAIPAIGNIIENSRVGAIKSDAQNAIAAANIYYTDNPDEAGPVDVFTLLADDYLQDSGSLDAAATGTIITKVTGGNTISGTGEAGGVSIEFTGATNTAIADVANSSATGTTAVAITR
ncbi:MAG: prepilin-type N-terminal cleavage/methylation domain-containing protein [Paenisporosarcina sp.]